MKAIIAALALSLTTPLYANPCNCIVNPLPDGRFDIKCDIPSIIVFTNTPPIYNKTEPPKTVIPVVPKPPVNNWTQPKQNNSTIAIDPETGRMIFK